MAYSAAELSSFANSGSQKCCLALAGLQVLQYDNIHSMKAVAFESRDNRWRVTAAGENLGDEKYLIGTFAVGGLRMSSGYFNPPRRLAVTLRYSYN